MTNLEENRNQIENESLNSLKINDIKDDNKIAIDVLKNEVNLFIKKEKFKKITI